MHRVSVGNRQKVYCEKNFASAIGYLMYAINNVLLPKVQDVHKATARKGGGSSELPTPSPWLHPCTQCSVTDLPCLGVSLSSQIEEDLKPFPTINLDKWRRALVEKHSNDHFAHYTI